MKKIWQKFCNWLITKLGGMPRWMFEGVVKVQNAENKELKDENKALKIENRYLRKDIDDVVRENTVLKCDLNEAEQTIASNEEYISKMKAPKREFVNMEYVAMYNKATTEEELKFFATQGLFEKMKGANVVKYDFRDGVCVASLEVIL